MNNSQCPYLIMILDYGQSEKTIQRKCKLLDIDCMMIFYDFCNIYTKEFQKKLKTWKKL